MCVLHQQAEKEKGIEDDENSVQHTTQLSV